MIWRDRFLCFVIGLLIGVLGMYVLQKPRFEFRVINDRPMRIDTRTGRAWIYLNREIGWRELEDPKMREASKNSK